MSFQFDCAQVRSCHGVDDESHRAIADPELVFIQTSCFDIEDISI